MPHSYLETGIVAILAAIAIYCGGTFYLNWHADRAALDKLSHMSEALGYDANTFCQNRYEELTFRGKAACMGR